MPLALRVEAVGRSHVGLVRKRNEDRFYLGQSLVAVADGMGGHPAGNVASDTAIKALSAFDRPVEPAGLPAALAQGVNAVNVSLRRRIEDDSQLAGMGTTLVALLWSGATAVLANVGDSRAYLLRNASSGHGKTVQITEDHTYEHLVADAAGVPNLPERLARFLDGRLDGRSPDLTSWVFNPGDRFLLCSDGLSSFVPHDLIHATLSSASGLSVVADRLVTLAIDNGGPDNVTVIIIDVRDGGRSGP